MSNVIEAQGLAKAYGRHLALDGVDLVVPQGKVFGVIGPNGAGKTTFMRLMLDLIRPTAGSLSVLGESPRRGGAALRRRIGYLPGEIKLQNNISGHRLLTEFARISGPVDKTYVAELAERLGIDLSLRIRSLSKGNKQKISLIQAFMHKPELLVLDEPTSGLDPLVQREFHAITREAVQNGQTVFLSSHVMSEVQDIADDIAILKRGEIVEVTTVAEIRDTAGRHVRIIPRNVSEEQARATLARIPGMSELEIITNSKYPLDIRADIVGNVDALVKAVAGWDLIDLVLEEPNLEETVLSLYEEGGRK